MCCAGMMVLGAHYFVSKIWPVVKDLWTNWHKYMFEGYRPHRVTGWTQNHGSIVQVKIDNYQCETKDCKNARSIISLNCKHCNQCAVCFEAHLADCAANGKRVECNVCRTPVGKYIQMFVIQNSFI